MTMCCLEFRLVILTIMTVHIKGDIVSVSCSHITSPVNVLNLTNQSAENISGYSVNITTQVESNVFIESACCENMRISTVQCSRVCTPSGLKMCKLTATNDMVLTLDDCLNAPYVNVSCMARRPVTTMSPATLQTLSSSTTSTHAGSTSTVHIQTSQKQPLSTLGTSTEQQTENNTEIISNNSSHMDFTTSYVVTKTTNESASTSTFDEQAAMKDLYTFLIVLGVVLVLVVALVCVFFLRKKRDKVSITHVDYPLESLEYWHGQEYIDNVVEKSFCPKSTSFTVNPVYDSSRSRDEAAQRYKKKDESDNASRHTDGQNKSHGRHELKRSNATRQRSNGSDVPRKTKHDYAEKYVATAAGSNFYSYSQSPDVEQSTNLDDDSDCDATNHSYGNSKNSSFKPSTGKGVRRKRRSTDDKRSSDWEDGDDKECGLYAISYKDRLKRRLDDGSAEESDV